MQATLKTTRLTLKPLSDDNLEDLVQLNADELVMKYLTGKGHTREEATRDFERKLAKATSVPGLGVWAGYKDGEFVGTWTINPDKDCDGNPLATHGQLGYRIGSKHWRQGLAKEATKELLRHAFEDLNVQEIWAQTMAVNKASRATMESCGMKFVRVFHEEFDDPLPGTEKGEVEYKITREEWASLRT